MPGTPCLKGGLLRIGTEVATLDEVFTAAQGFGTPGKYAVLVVADGGVGMDEKPRGNISSNLFLRQKKQEKGRGSGFPWYTA